MDFPGSLKEIASWLQIRKGGRHSELRFKKKDAEHVLGLTVARITFATQQSGGLLVTGADIPERRQLEMQVRQAQKLQAPRLQVCGDRYRRQRMWNSIRGPVQNFLALLHGKARWPRDGSGPGSGAQQYRSAPWRTIVVRECSGRRVDILYPLANFKGKR